MNNPSEKIALRTFDQSRFLRQSTITQMPLVSSRLSEAYGALPPTLDSAGNAVVTNWEVLQQSNVAMLEEATRRAVEASQTYRVKRADLSEFRRLRRAGVKALASHHAHLRQSFLGSYQAKLLPLVGLEAPASKAYSAVLDCCQAAVHRMKAPEVLIKLGDRRPNSPVLVFAELAQGLKDAIEAYDILDGNVLEGVKVHDEAYVAKRQALADLRRVNANLGRVQEGLYRLVGLDKLADRIRMTIP